MRVLRSHQEERYLVELVGFRFEGISVSFRRPITVKIDVPEFADESYLKSEFVPKELIPTFEPDPVNLVPRRDRRPRIASGDRTE